MSTDTEYTVIKRMTLAQLVGRFNRQKSAGINVCTKDLKYELLEHGYTLEAFKLAQKMAIR